MKIDSDALAILDACRVEENSVFLPSGQLPRPLYVKVDKALQCLGGKWNKKKKAHLFDHNPADDLEAAVLSGEVLDPKKFFQFFETPPEIVTRMVSLANLTKDDDVLEPSAGKGAIAREIGPLVETVRCVEINPEWADALRKDFMTVQQDFLTVPPDPVCDAVVMNPPFCRQQDIDHVLHAFEFLKPGGRLVAVMSEGTFFRETKKAKEFRDWMERNGGVSEPNPIGTFKGSGTMVASRIILVKKRK